MNAIIIYYLILNIQMIPTNFSRTKKRL